LSFECAIYLINSERPFHPVKMFLGNSTQSYVNRVAVEGQAVINGTHPHHTHVPLSQSFSTSVKIVVFGAAGLVVFLVLVSLALYVYRTVFLNKRKKRNMGGLESSDSTWSDKTLKGEEEERIRSAI